MAEMSEAKKRARAATLGAPSGAFKTIGVKIGDELFAVREPTVREHGQIMKDAAGEGIAAGRNDIDIARLRVAAVVKCAYTAEPVLEADPDADPLPDVPVLDAQGNPTPRPDGQGPMLVPAPRPMRVKTETVPVLDAQDKPVLDASGKPKTEQRPVVRALERIFDDTDVAALMEQPVSGFVGELAGPAMRLVNAKQEDARKSG